MIFCKPGKQTPKQNQVQFSQFQIIFTILTQTESKCKEEHTPFILDMTKQKISPTDHTHNTKFIIPTSWL